MVLMKHTEGQKLLSNEISIEHPFEHMRRKTLEVSRRRSVTSTAQRSSAENRQGNRRNQSPPSTSIRQHTSRSGSKSPDESAAMEEIAVTLKYLDLLDACPDDGKGYTTANNPIMITCQFQECINQLREARRKSNRNGGSFSYQYTDRITDFDDLTYTDCLVMYAKGLPPVSTHRKNASMWNPERNVPKAPQRLKTQSAPSTPAMMTKDAHGFFDKTQSNSFPSPLSSCSLGSYPQQRPCKSTSQQHASFVDSAIETCSEFSSGVLTASSTMPFNLLEVKVPLKSRLSDESLPMTDWQTIRKKRQEMGSTAMRCKNNNQRTYYPLAAFHHRRPQTSQSLRIKRQQQSIRRPLRNPVSVVNFIDLMKPSETTAKRKSIHSKPDQNGTRSQGEECDDEFDIPTPDLSEDEVVEKRLRLPCGTRALSSTSSYRMDRVAHL
ncbi:hypothetical protein ACOME3_009185 [Neoechinorhynchus agilis]